MTMRSRVIKPGLFLNEQLASVSYDARWLFIGLICLADREGRFEWRPKRIAAEVFPYEKIEVEQLLSQLVLVELIRQYEVDGKLYGDLPNFSKHQPIHKHESPSSIPAFIPSADGTCPDMSGRGRDITRHVGSRFDTTDMASIKGTGNSNGSGRGTGTRQKKTSAEKFKQPDNSGNPRESFPEYPFVWLSEAEYCATLNDFTKAGLRVDFHEKAFQRLNTWFKENESKWLKSSDHLSRLTGWVLTETLKAQEQTDRAAKASAVRNGTDKIPLTKFQKNLVRMYGDTRRDPIDVSDNLFPLPELGDQPGCGSVVEQVSGQVSDSRPQQRLQALPRKQRINVCANDLGDNSGSLGGEEEAAAQIYGTTQSERSASDSPAAPAADDRRTPEAPAFVRREQAARISRTFE